MKPAQDLYFNFYPSHFMNGVRGMSAQEVGIYTMMLCRIYEENGPVEFHELRLATYCGMRVATFRSTIAKLVDLGKLTIVDGMLSNDRAEVEIEARSMKVRIASRAGKASANKRENRAQNASRPHDVEIGFTGTDEQAEKSQQNQQEKSTGVERTFNQGEGEGESSSSAREARDDPSSWNDDELLSQVMAAVGICDRIPAHWMPPAATIHVGRWRRDLKLTCLSIVTAAKNSRKRHDEPPNGPKALDGVMRGLAATISAEPLRPTTGGPTRQDDRARKINQWNKIAAGGSQ